LDGGELGGSQRTRCSPTVRRRSSWRSPSSSATPGARRRSAPERVDADLHIAGQLEEPVRVAVEPDREVQVQLSASGFEAATSRMLTKFLEMAARESPALDGVCDFGDGDTRRVNVHHGGKPHE
jgi:hypothetical protein